jgi:P4 family phage/plasmid primase-like protien
MSKKKNPAPPMPTAVQEEQSRPNEGAQHSKKGTEAKDSPSQVQVRALIRDANVPITAAHCAAVLDFFLRWRPDGEWVVAAIHPQTGKIDGAVFRGKEGFAALADWIKARNGKSNLYFGDSDVLPTFTGKRASRTDIQQVGWLHVDIDARPANPAWTPEEIASNFEKELVRILDSLTVNLPKGVPPPTVIIFSGGGFQAFWRLEEPLVTAGDEAKANDAALYNVWLQEQLDGDSCQSIDHIMRLPNTKNIPDKKKIAKGRKPALTKVVLDVPERIYPLSAFGKSAGSRMVAKSAKAGDAKAVAFGEPRYHHTEADLDALLARVTGDVNRQNNMKLAIIDPERLAELEPPLPGETRKSERSGVMFRTLMKMAAAGMEPPDMLGLLLDPAWPHLSAHILDPKRKGMRPLPYAEKQVQDALDKVAPATPDGEAAPKPKATPLLLAAGLLKARRGRLLRHSAEWLTYDGGYYRALEDDSIRQEIYRRYSAFDSSKVSQTVDALNALVHVDRHALTPPCWLKGGEGRKPESQLVLRNGTLDLESNTFHQHDDALFTRNALPYEYRPDAPPPERWLRFLDEIWPDEPDCAVALQQMFGYLLTPDTSQQKIFVLVGKPRCGKGTIGRLLRQLLGERNVCSPSIHGLGEPFGLQCAIGKQLAMISDMRLDQKTNKAALMENLLRVSGEDAVNVQRKNTVDWEGRLTIRFVILSNDPPTLNDPSGALLARYIVLPMGQSFIGREDLALDDKLAAEMPGILNWAIAGRKSLREKGRFAQPRSASDLTNTITRLSSPVSAFIDDECTLFADGKTEKDELYRRFKEWCVDQDIKWKGSKEVFAKDLFTVCGTKVHSAKLRDGDKRVPTYTGIAVRPGKWQPQPEDDAQPPPEDEGRAPF